MASTVSEYLVKAVSVRNGSSSFKGKMRILGDQYDSLANFKTATIEFLLSLRNAEGNPLIRSFTEKEKADIIDIQREIDCSQNLEANFVKMLTSAFVVKQLNMLNDMSLDNLNTNPLLCVALKLGTPYELVKYNVYALATRSIVTSMGFLVQDLLLYSSSDVYNGKDYREGGHVKWDLVVERLDAVKCYIEVKSGPNDLDKTQVSAYQNEIIAVENQGHKGYIGITYGKRESETVSINLFKQYLEKWEERTLIGSELWGFITENESYHQMLMERILGTSETLLSDQSIIDIIESKVNDLTNQFNERYGSIEGYLNSLW